MPMDATAVVHAFSSRLVLVPQVFPFLAGWLRQH